MKNTIGIILVTLCLLSSCKEFITLEYENDPALYFVHAQYGQQDSLNHTFFLRVGDKTRDTAFVEIITMGYPSSENREISLIQTNSGQPGAAIPGVHYIPFDNPEVKPHMVIPAGAVRARVPVILLNDQTLALSSVRLNLEIVPNSHFRQGVSEFSQFLIKTTAQAVKPSNWDSVWRYYFGATWGSVKMEFIISVLGYVDWSVRPGDIGYTTYIGAKTKAALEQYNLDHPTAPLKEADGTLVTFN